MPSEALGPRRFARGHRTRRRPPRHSSGRPKTCGQSVSVDNLQLMAADIGAAVRSACSDNRGMAAIVSSALNRLANCAFRPIPAPRCGPRFHLELPPCGSTRSEWRPTSYPHCCCHNSGMVAITIRDVPTHVRDELAARAARAGQSLQEYLRGLLVSAADKSSADDVISRARARVETTGARLDAASVLAAKDANRR